MSQIKPPDCTTIVGMRGSGKSFLAREIGAAYPKQVIFDPVADWHDGVVVNSFNEFCEKIVLFKNPKEGKLIYRFSPDDENLPEQLNEALRIVYHMGDCQVVIDEIQLFCTPQYMPPWLEKLYFIGRHQKIGVTAITQRPSKLNKSCLSQSNHVFVGQLHEKNDISVVANFLNVSYQDISRLKPREFFYYSPTYGMNKFSTEKNQNKQNKKIKSK